MTEQETRAMESAMEAFAELPPDLQNWAYGVIVGAGLAVRKEVNQ